MKTMAKREEKARVDEFPRSTGEVLYLITLLSQEWHIIIGGLHIRSVSNDDNEEEPPGERINAEIDHVSQPKDGQTKTKKMNLRPNHPRTNRQIENQQTLPS